MYIRTRISRTYLESPEKWSTKTEDIEKYPRTDNNVIALNDAIRASDYLLADETQRRIDRNTERNRGERQRHAANKHAFARIKRNSVRDACHI